MTGRITPDRGKPPEVFLSCGCLVHRQLNTEDLIIRYCKAHFAENEQRQRAMRERARKRQAERVVFSNEQVFANLERMQG